MQQQTYYGFHGHLLLSATGVITSFSLTPANGSERETLWEMVDSIGGRLVGDWWAIKFEQLVAP